MEMHGPGFSNNTHEKGGEREVSSTTSKESTSFSILSKNLNKNSNSRIWQNIIAIINRYGDLALPTKLAISALLGILAGPGLLGLISEYATYNFAFYEGVRPPLEGVPYLKAAVTTATFILLLGGAVAFILTYFYTKLIIMVFSTILLDAVKKSKIASDFSSLSIWWIIFFGIYVGLVFVITIIPNIYFNSSVKVYDYIGGKEFLMYAAILTFMFGFITTFLIWRNYLIWFMASISAIFLIILSFYMMFVPEYYGKFLRYLKYGGGIYITVKLDQPDQAEYSAYLVLRTSEALLLFYPTFSLIREVPIRDAKSLKHYAFPFLQEPSYVLPSTRSFSQNLEP